MNRFFLLFGLFVLLRGPMSAQQQTIIKHEVFGVEDGLASELVTCGLQDKRGFLWFGTVSGLDRYDGKQFQLFDKKNGLWSNKILIIVEDGSGHIWVMYDKEEGLEAGNRRIDLIDERSCEVISFDRYFVGAPFKSGEVACIEPDGVGGLYVIVYPKVIYHYSLAEGFKKMVSGSNWGTYSEDLNPNVTARREGIYLSNDLQVLGGKTFDLSKEPGTLIGFEDRGKKVVVNCIASENGEMVVRSYDGSGRPPEKKVIDCPYPDIHETFLEAYQLIIFDNFHGDALIITTKKSYIFDGNQFKVLMDESMFGLMLTGYFRDDQGNFWLTSTQGLHKVQWMQNPFEVFFSDDKMREKTPFGSQVRSIYCDEGGNIYASIFFHFFKYNVRTGEYQKIISKHEGTMVVEPMGDKLLGFGTKYIGVFTKEPLSSDFLRPGKFTDGQIDSLHHLTGNIWSGYPLGDMKFLIGAEKGFFLLDANNDMFQKVGFCGDSMPPPLSIYRILYSDQDHLYWAAGSSGLYALRPDFCLAEYDGKNVPDKAHYLPSSQFHDLHEDKDGIFWLASKDEGLVRWDRRTRVAESFGTANGLPTNFIYCILEDGVGKLWLSTDRGIVCFDKKSHQVQIYSMTEGLPALDFNRVSKYKSADGTLYFGCINGLVRFRPWEMPGMGHVEDIPLEFTYLKQLGAGDDDLTDRTYLLLNAGYFEIAPGTKYSEIGFGLLDYSAPPLKYNYWIEGLDAHWSETSDGFLRIAALPFGDYTLHIKAQSHLGVWSSKELVVAFRVVRPFYNTWWFYLMVTLLAILVVVLIVRFYTKSLKRRNTLLENKIKQRTEALSEALSKREVLLKEIHHRVKNNLQVIGSLVDLQQRGMVDGASKWALDTIKMRVRSVALIHQLLYQNEDIGNIDVEEFIRKLFAQVEKVFGQESRKVELNTSIQPYSFDLDTFVPLGLILNELFTNAFKYAFHQTGQGLINIEFLKSGDSFELSFSDNGPGLPEGIGLGISKSLGMTLLKGLSKQLGGKIEYDNRSGAFFHIVFLDPKIFKQTD